MDPQFNSIHLEAPNRREAFRRAREAMSAALGERTLTGDCAIGNRLPGHPSDLDTTLNTSTVSYASLFWRGRSWELRLGINSVGRLPDNQICLDDPSVSRRHCAVVVHSNFHIEVHDIASKNGTAVNGHPISGSTEIKQGDEIAVGEHRLVLIVNPTPQPPTALPVRTDPTMIL